MEVRTWSVEKLLELFPPTPRSLGARIDRLLEWRDTVELNCAILRCARNLKITLKDF